MPALEEAVWVGSTRQWDNHDYCLYLDQRYQLWKKRRGLAARISGLTTITARGRPLRDWTGHDKVSGDSVTLRRFGESGGRHQLGDSIEDDEQGDGKRKLAIGGNRRTGDQLTGGLGACE